MEGLKFFKGEKLPVYRMTPSVIMRNIPKDMSQITGEKPMPVRDNIDYVKKFQEEEDKLLLEYANSLYNPPVNLMEQMSVGTAPTVDELNTEDREELNKVYDTFRFDHKPDPNLTILTRQKEIVNMISTNSVVIIQGPTGCGKTTQVPQFILDDCKRKREYCNIIVTQPRRIAAVSIANRVCKERNWPEGSLVGFQIGMVKRTGPDTRLTYCTTGVLLHKLIFEKNMNNFTHVILDEVHERDKNIDFLLLVVRKLLRTNSRNVKVILMSATINIDKFRDYFRVAAGQRLLPAPVIDIEKRNFYTIHTYYICQLEAYLGEPPIMDADEPKVTQDLIEYTAKLVTMFNDVDIKDASDDPRQPNRHSVLIFLPGIHEIEEVYNIFSSDCFGKNHKWDIVILHSTITYDEQKKIFERPPTGYRRVILSTNIAESSITVPNVQYVIDFCLTKQLVTNRETNYQSLELKWASKANCDQRAGRTGRVMEGRVYRMVPSSFYHKHLKDEGEPEMQRSPLENLVLMAKRLDMGKPKALLALAMDPPNLCNLEQTCLKLQESGALTFDPNNFDSEDGDLTDLGKIMSHLPLDIQVSKLIVLGYIFNVFKETIIIGAALSVKSMFNAPFKKKIESYNARLTWSSQSCSDCLTYWQAYEYWQKEKNAGRLKKSQELEFAKRHFVQIQVLREMKALVDEITLRLSNLGIAEFSSVEKNVFKDQHQKSIILKIVIAGAFYPNYFVKKGLSEIEDDNMRLLDGKDPLKTVILRGWPTNQPGRLYARRIQDLFAPCVEDPRSSTRVTFDGSSRVYVEFDCDEDEQSTADRIPGNVAPAVYKALKLRQENAKMNILVLDDHSSNQLASKMGVETRTTSFVRDELIKKIPKKAFKPELPSLDTAGIPIFVRHVANPGRFWTMTNENCVWEKYNMVHNYLKQCKLKRLDVLPEIGELVIARRRLSGSSECIWSRASVERVIHHGSAPRVGVFFIDYGSTDTIPLSELRLFDYNSSIARVPALAFECVLAQIAPARTTSPVNDWSREVYDKFATITSGKDITLYGQVYSVVNGVVAIDLMYEKLSQSGGARSFNQELVSERLADAKEESYTSKKNRQLRDTYKNMTADEKAHHENEQHDHSFVEKYPEPPLEIDCRRRVNFKGPESPLEINLFHLCRSGAAKTVHIDKLSVNSVLLNANPGENHEQLLVAASINQGMSGGNLTIRNTTLMPNSPGFSALMTMIFTPQMELRMNDYGTRYIGAICGMGYHRNEKDKFHGYPIFASNDIEISFDVDFDLEDLKTINKIRHWMNIGIQIRDEASNQPINPSDVSLIQRSLHEAVFNLLRKRREPQDPKISKHAGSWNRLQKYQVLKPGLSKGTFIYSLHGAVELNPKNLQRERQLEHFIELRDAANNDTSGKKEYTCKACKKTMIGVTSLRAHVFSREHQKEEQKVPI